MEQPLTPAGEEKSAPPAKKRGRPRLTPVPKHAVEDPSVLPDDVRERYLRHREAIKNDNQRRRERALAELAEATRNASPGENIELPSYFARRRECSERSYYLKRSSQLAAERARKTAAKATLKAALYAEWAALWKPPPDGSACRSKEKIARGEWMKRRLAELSEDNLTELEVPHVN